MKGFALLNSIHLCSVTATEFLSRSSYEFLCEVFLWRKMKTENRKESTGKTHVLLYLREIMKPMFLYNSN